MSQVFETGRPMSSHGIHNVFEIYSIHCYYLKNIVICLMSRLSESLFVVQIWNRTQIPLRQITDQTEFLAKLKTMILASFIREIQHSLTFFLLILWGWELRGESISPFLTEMLFQVKIFPIILYINIFRMINTSVKVEIVPKLQRRSSEKNTWHSITGATHILFSTNFQNVT